MFWTRITKGFLKVQVAIGVLASLGGAFATGSAAGIGVFFTGVVVTFALLCVLGTFCEISEGVAKLSNQIVGQSASDRELNRRLNSIENSMEKMMNTAKKQGSATVKKTAEKIANSIQDPETLQQPRPVNENRNIEKPMNVSYEDDLDKTMAYHDEDEIVANNDIQDDGDKTTVLPMDVIMNKVNGGKQEEVAGSFCPVCGTKNETGSAFCFNCGNKL